MVEYCMVLNLILATWQGGLNRGPVWNPYQRSTRLNVRSLIIAHVDSSRDKDPP